MNMKQQSKPQPATPSNKAPEKKPQPTPVAPNQPKHKVGK